MADEYISRKAAMEYLYRALNADPEGNCPSCIHDEHDCQYDRCWTLMDFCEKVEYLGYVPAADVAPVRHGRWELDVLDGTPGYRPVCIVCSKCHRINYGATPYCPNCGASMMDGEA